MYSVNLGIPSQLSLISYSSLQQHACLFLLDSLFIYTPENFLPLCFGVLRKVIYNLSSGNAHFIAILLIHYAFHSLCTHFLLNYNFFLEVTVHRVTSGTRS